MGCDWHDTEPARLASPSRPCRPWSNSPACLLARGRGRARAVRSSGGSDSRCSRRRPHALARASKRAAASGPRESPSPTRRITRCSPGACPADLLSTSCSPRIWPATAGITSAPPRCVAQPVTSPGRSSTHAAAGDRHRHGLIVIVHPARADRQPRGRRDAHRVRAGEGVGRVQLRPPWRGLQAPVDRRLRRGVRVAEVARERVPTFEHCLAAAARRDGCLHPGGQCERRCQRAAPARSERAAEAPLGRTRRLRCIGTTSAGAGSPS